MESRRPWRVGTYRHAVYVGWGNRFEPLWERMSADQNHYRTVVMLATLAVLVLVVGHRLGGIAGLSVALLVALILVGCAYRWSDRIALRSMRAYPVGEADYPELCQVVRELSQTMRLPMPAIYVSPTPAPNTFVTGRSPRRSAICVTEGLLGSLNRRELRGVVAHELSHIANRDLLLCSGAAALASMIVYLAHVAWMLPFGRSADAETNLLGRVLLVVFGPVAALVVRSAISRSREYAADATAVRVTGEPLALADGLRVVEEGTRRLPLRPQPVLQSTGALMIANPFRRGGLVSRMFATHPPTARRISRLEDLAG